MSAVSAQADAPMDGPWPRTRRERLREAAARGAMVRSGAWVAPVSEEVNNHVHTIYSFSPYSPAEAVWRAWRAGLRSVGIMDHDSVGGCREMLAAARAIGLACTCGFEMRVAMEGTAFEGRRLNHPDALGLAYVAAHGLPRNRITAAEAFLRPIRVARNRRNRAMVARLNACIEPYGLAPLDFGRDVQARSMARWGGSITERHILAALARRCIETFGPGEPLVKALRARLGVEAPARVAEWLADPANPHTLYDVIGLLKVSFLERFLVQPSREECPPIGTFVTFARSVQALPVYAYLGDVQDSPTGDKKAERFEDAYLDELMSEIVRLGCVGVTYMPPRNTLQQLQRVQRLCRRHGLMEISGVDINSSRQSFRCPVLLEPAFKHLVEATWALIAHEKLAALDARQGLFHPRNPWADASLDKRVARYASVGRRLDPRHPWRMENV